ncbi:hypothetical protein ACQKWADRAFT_300252 [Trichoderma austrokoningii]
MPTSPPSDMLSKWSSKSPRQKAIRIRNNQRRHRNKIKDRIYTLETELTESQRRLVTAENLIMALTAELRRLREPSFTKASSAQHSSESLTPRTILEPPYCHRSEIREQLGNSLSSEHDVVFNQPSDRPAISNSILKDNNVAPLEINIGNGTEADDPTLVVAFVAQYDSQTLPPPQPSESTTNCVAAYGIIGQQNFKNVGMDVMHQWLQSGYRRETRPGDGCTVVNSHLYSLLSYLSPV